jgi:hypothetical protein
VGSLDILKYHYVRKIVTNYNNPAFMFRCNEEQQMLERRALAATSNHGCRACGLNILCVKASGDYCL